MTQLTPYELEFLIETTRNEDVHVDFKQVHHDNDTDLIHDILCMANADCAGSRFIIYGVQDKTANIVGIRGDNNRRKRDREKIINMLRNAEINQMPFIDLYTVTLRGLKIDVLKIENLPHKPYYLNKDHTTEKRFIRRGSIYSREGNTNIPINLMATEVQIEKMYRERFVLVLNPLERILNYIDDTDRWVKVENSQLLNTLPALSKLKQSIYHYSNFPEFTLEGLFNETRRDYHGYWNNRNKNSPGGYELGDVEVSLKYHSTVLARTMLVNVEDKGLCFAQPKFINPDDAYNDPRAFIDINKLEHKVGAIFSGYKSMEDYTYDLKSQNQYLHNFDISFR